MLGDAYLLKEVSLGNIGFAFGSVFASGSYHLDFATQDQIVFILLPLGDEVHCAQVSMHPEAILLPVVCLLPLGMRIRI